MNLNRIIRLGVALGLVLLAAAGGTERGIGISPPAAAQPAGSGHLVVADMPAAKLYVSSLDTLEQVGTVDGTLADHAGFLALPDGRLLYVDAATSELVALRLDTAGGPAVVGRTPLPADKDVSHIAVNPSATHAVVGAGSGGRGDLTLTLVDLTTFTSTTFPIEGGEAGLAMGDDPLTIYHRNDAARRIEAFPIERVLRGDHTPAATAPTGAAGHGEVISHTLKRLYAATDSGVEVVELDGDSLRPRTVIPWQASGRDRGRAFALRLSDDGGFIYSYIADRPEGIPWAEWRNDAYIVDLAGERPTRLEIGPGVTYRQGLSDRYALYFNLHPGGDVAHLLDVGPASPAFQQVVARIPLPAASTPLRPETSPFSQDARRHAAMTPDGHFGFITQGGDGQVHVIDTEQRRIVRTIQTPSALNGGGYLVAVQPGARMTDTIAR